MIILFIMFASLVAVCFYFIVENDKLEEENYQLKIKDLNKEDIIDAVQN